MTISDPAPATRAAPSEIGAALDLPVLHSALLASRPWVVHGLTRRVPGLGRADGNLGFSPPRDAADAWAMRRLWCAAVGVDAERLVTTGQVHGAAVRRVRAGEAGRGARPASAQLSLADAMITDEPGVVLLSLHADCLPVLLVDPDRTAIGVVHAGWRGTVADVTGASVRAMAAAFGSEPARLLAYLGPAIGACCYEVGPEVAAAWADRDGRAGGPLKRTEAGWIFDLTAANESLLTRAGVRPGRIERSGVCTRCGDGDWFSHRGQGATTGRFGALIALRGER